MSERLVILENANANANANANVDVDVDVDVDAATQCACNPFDFNTIYDPWEREDENEDMPALDLIVNHYPDYDEAIDEAIDEDIDEDDMFEVVQIFDLPAK